MLIIYRNVLVQEKAHFYVASLASETFATQTVKPCTQRGTNGSYYALLVPASALQMCHFLASRSAASTLHY